MRCVTRVGALLPLWTMQCAGSTLGFVAGWLPTRSRTRSLVNIRLCFPELSDRERRRMARRSLASLGSMALELPAFWGWKRARVLALVKSVEGQEHLDAALASGRGVLLAMPHIGAWELAGLHCSARYPMTGLYRPVRIREADALFLAGRTRFGATMSPAGVAGVRSLRRALQSGAISIMLPDTDPNLGQSVFAPLFGEPANTSILVSRLARGSGAAVLMCFVERLGIGRGFRVHFRPTSPEVIADDPVCAASAMNREIESVIRHAPHQYLWRYRRFRNRPEGSPSLYARRRTAAK